jgi:hypothetical protein
MCRIFPVTAGDDSEDLDPLRQRQPLSPNELEVQKLVAWRLKRYVCTGTQTLIAPG